jgi:hypothetical protein
MGFTTRLRPLLGGRRARGRVAAAGVDAGEFFSWPPGWALRALSPRAGSSEVRRALAGEGADAFGALGGAGAGDDARSLVFELYLQRGFGGAAQKVF